VSQLARDGFDEAYGARPLQRHIRRTLEKALTRAILAGDVADGDRVRVGADGTVAVDAHVLALAA
jgi:ATP-dependent Clp protease ATP-binding subunit ClpC